MPEMTKEELDALAHGIAYDSCCSIIDCNTLSSFYAGLEYFDVAPVSDGSSAEPPIVASVDAKIAEAVKYLEARGLIDHHPDNPNWVTIHDESEATR
jgi:hypothetical protein